MSAIIYNPYKKKRKSTKKTATKTKKKTASENKIKGAYMAKKKKKKRSKKRNPIGNPRRMRHTRARRHTRRNPAEKIADVMIGALCAAGGGIGNNLLAGLVARFVDPNMDETKVNLIKGGSALAAALFLPKVLPKHIALPMAYGAFGALGASVGKSAFNIGEMGYMGAGSLDVQRIINEIDNPGMSGLIEDQTTSGYDDDMSGDDDYLSGSNDRDDY